MMNEALDRQAIVDIYEMYSSKIFRYGYRLLGDRDKAEECMAETFSRFLNSLVGKPEGPKDVQAYLYRIAHNWITDYFRQKSVVSSDDFEDLIPDRRNGNPASLTSQKLEIERMRRALQLLPEEQRQVVTLRFLEEQSHEQVATALGKSTEATRAIQYRALNSLRRMLYITEEV